MNPYNFAILFFSFCTLIIAIIILLKRRDAVGWTYFVFSMFVCLWGVGFAICVSSGVSYELALFSIRSGSVATAFICVTWYHFVLVLTGVSKLKTNFVLYLFYVLSIFFALFTHSPYFIPSVSAKLSFEYYGDAGPIYYFFTAYFFIATSLGFIRILKKLKSSSGMERKQLTGVFWSKTFGFFGGSLTFFPVFNIMVPQYAIFLMPFYPAVMVYVLTRQQFLDPEEIAQAVHKEKLAAVGILAASINHEIKSPVYVIKSLAESHMVSAAEKRFKDMEEHTRHADETIQKVFKQAERVSDMVQRLSRFAKTGLSEKVSLEAVDLNSVLDDILPLVQYDFLIHHVEIIREVPKDLSPIRADVRYVEEILFNLLVNAGQAIKGSGKEGVIRIQATDSSVILNEAESRVKNLRSLPTGQAGFARPTDSLRMTRGGRVIQITISDNGSGIPKDKLAHIFKPFYTTKQEGSGLGLYITKQLMEKLRGTIEVDSSPRGTAFTLQFLMNPLTL